MQAGVQTGPLGCNEYASGVSWISLGESMTPIAIGHCKPLRPCGHVLQHSLEPRMLAFYRMHSAQEAWCVACVL